MCPELVVVFVLQYILGINNVLKDHTLILILQLTITTQTNILIITIILIMTSHHLRNIA